MKTKKFDVAAYLAGKVALADTVNPGFRRDLHLARDLLRRLQRRGDRVASPERQA